MVSITKYGNSINGEILVIDGLSTDTKPLNTNGGCQGHKIYNGSTFNCMDTHTSFKFNEANDTWLAQQ